MPPRRPPPLRPPSRLERRRHAQRDAPAPPPFINLCGDYRFLRAGYWALVDAELRGVAASPTTLQAATVQNAAACLLVARRAGVPCADWSVVRGPEEIQPPSVLVPVSGITGASYLVRTRRSAGSQFRRASQNGTRSVLAVALPGALRSMRTVVGLTTSAPVHLAWDLWQALGIPLSTVWYVEDAAMDPDGEQARFLGLDPLPLHELTHRELVLLEEVSRRPMSPL